jgi:hypothetical protein
MTPPGTQGTTALQTPKSTSGSLGFTAFQLSEVVNDVSGAERLLSSKNKC